MQKHTKSFLKDYRLFISRKAKKMMEAVFGKGLIKECYIAEYNFVGEDKDELQNRLKESIERWENCIHDQVVLDWGCFHFVVVFVNDSTVRFTNSEWASFTKLDTEAVLAHAKKEDTAGG